jgi:hypothetical protein
MYLAHHALKCSNTIILICHVDHVLLVVIGKHPGKASDITWMGFACSTAPQEQTVSNAVVQA